MTITNVSKVQEYVANYINAGSIESLTATSGAHGLSPPAFRYQLTELARKAGKRIVLPEGDEPRTVQAAAICAERGIATCVLLGNPAEINRVAASQYDDLQGLKSLIQKWFAKAMLVVWSNCVRTKA
ncbi:phosphate acyltransferase [Escherichia coli]